MIKRGNEICEADVVGYSESLALLSDEDKAEEFASKFQKNLLTNDTIEDAYAKTIGVKIEDIDKEDYAEFISHPMIMSVIDRISMIDHITNFDLKNKAMAKLKDVMETNLDDFEGEERAKALGEIVKASKTIIDATSIKKTSKKLEISMQTKSKSKQQNSVEQQIGQMWREMREEFGN